jgi:hypothetical protein
MTISLDELAELAAAPCTQPWWNEMELRKGVRHIKGDTAFIAACSPDVILKLLAVVKAAEYMQRSSTDTDYARLAKAFEELDTP